MRRERGFKSTGEAQGKVEHTIYFTHPNFIKFSVRVIYGCGVDFL